METMLTKVKCVWKKCCFVVTWDENERQSSRQVLGIWWVVREKA